MRCKNCGNEVSENDKFCSNCGTKLKPEVFHDNGETTEPEIDDAPVKTVAQKMIDDAKAARAYEKEKGYVSAYELSSSPEKFEADKLSWYPGKKRDDRKEKISELEKTGEVYCPKCLSTRITANKKGFNFVRGALGSAIGLDVGMIAGGIGAKKVVCTCLKCGYQWNAGKRK